MIRKNLPIWHIYEEIKPHITIDKGMFIYFIDETASDALNQICLYNEHENIIPQLIVDTVLIAGSQKMRITLGQSPLYSRDIATLFETYFTEENKYWFSKEHSAGQIDYICFCVTSASLDKLTTIFRQVNNVHKNSYILETLAIINDLFNQYNNSANWQDGKFTWFKIKNDISMMQSDKNDYLINENSTKLLSKILMSHLLHEPFEPLDMLPYLKRITDPNVVDANGYTALMLCTIYYSIEHVKLLLQYHADPLMRPPTMVGHHGCIRKSALELARIKGDADIFNCIGSLFTHPEVSISTNRKWIDTVTMNSDHDSILTYFNCSDGTVITTILRQTLSLSTLEKSDLYNLFLKYFEGNNNENIEETFYKNNLAGTNKIIEEILVNGCLVGFNLYEICQSTKIPNHVVIHYFYSLMENDSRSIGIMPLLSFRLFSALQNIFPPYDMDVRKNMYVGIFFSAISYDSYKFIEPFVRYSFPKQEPKNLISLVNNTLKEVFKKPNNIYQDGLICNITDDSALLVNENTSNAKRQKNIFHELFNAMKTSESGKAVPVFFYEVDVNRDRLNQSTARSGIDFNEHVSRYSEVLRPFTSRFFGVEKNNRKDDFSGYKKNRNVFHSWENTVFKEQECESNHISHRSKL